MKVEPYLFFSGNCEEAFNFYKSVFGGELVSVNRYGGSPLEKDAPPGWSEKIMHVTFVAGDLSMMGADSTMQPAGANNSRARLSVGTSSHEEGQRTFDALTAGGNVTLPYEKQFWGASFGMLVDRFGIEWMINAG